MEMGGRRTHSSAAAYCLPQSAIQAAKYWLKMQKYTEDLVHRQQSAVRGVMVLPQPASPLLALDMRVTAVVPILPLTASQPLY